MERKRKRQDGAEPQAKRHCITRTDKELDLQLFARIRRARGRVPDRDCLLAIGLPLDIEREPNNRYDVNAIQLLLPETGELLGYAPAPLSKQLAPLLDKNYVGLRVVIAKLTPLIVAFEVSLQGTVENFTDEAGTQLGNLRSLKSIEYSWDNMVSDRYDNRYVTTLNTEVSSVLARQSHLFAVEEVSLLKLGLDLEDTDARRTLARLLNRRSGWHHVEKLYFDEVPSLGRALIVLADAGLVHLSSSENNIDLTLLKNLTCKELKKFAITVKVSKVKGRKSDLLKSIESKLRQKSVFGKTLAQIPSIIKHFKSAVGEWVKVSEKVADAFTKANYLFYLGGRTDGITRERLGHFKFMEYPLSDESLFPDRETFERYYEAYQMCNQVAEAAHNEEDALVLELAEAAMTLYIGLELDDSQEVGIITRYRAQWQWGNILHMATKVLEKQKEYQRAVNMFMILLATQKSTSKRGYWYVRLAIDLEKHIKSLREAYDCCMQGIKDPYVREGDRGGLFARARKLATKLRCNLDTSPEEVGLLPDMDLPSVTFTGRPSQWGRTKQQKSIVFGYNNAMVSVEELAIQEFAQEENGSFKGIHCEGSLCSMLFGLFMVEEIYQDVPHVFQTKYQTGPIDLYTDLFYPTRKVVIDRRLATISTMDADTIREYITSMWNRYEGITIAGVNWERWSISMVADMAVCLGGATLMCIFARLASDWGYWGGGLPDLFLWDTSKEKCKLVEVKGPKDRLSDKQTAWLRYLLHNKVDASLCLIRTPTNHEPADSKKN